MKAEFEAFRAHTAQGGGVGSASAVSTTLHTLPAAVGGPQVLDYSRYDSPCYHDLCERSGCYGASAATKEVDLIFDNATDISVIGDERLALDLEPIDAHLRGFNGSSSRATAIATLPGRLGKALLVPGAQNLLGSKDLAEMGWHEQYRIPNSDGSWELVHKDGDVLRFEAVDYDRKSHLKLSLQEYYALSVNRFLQPEPPRNEEFLSLSDSQLRELELAKDLHASLNHPSKASLLSVIKSANGALRATTDGVELFYRLVKCPACCEGKMRSQDHIPSEASRTDYPIGYSSEMDVMKWGGSLYLISVDVASKMYFLTLISGRSVENLQKAIDDLISTYLLHGHNLKQVSCDRESAVSVMGAYLSSKGVSLDLKASGQKCPRVEVAIRSIKDTARATFYGIQNEFGYLLPAGRLRQLLLLDSVKVLNRRVRRNEARSPFELFTGKDIDYSRDFRAPFGAVVGAHRPRRGASRDTVEIAPKAEIGLVVIRPMDGTSTIGIYLPAKKAIIYALKFERIRPPDWLLHELRSHVPPIGINEQDSTSSRPTFEDVELEEGEAPDRDPDGAEGGHDDSTYVPSEDGGDTASEASEDDYLSIASGDFELSEGTPALPSTGASYWPLLQQEHHSVSSSQQRRQQQTAGPQDQQHGEQPGSSSEDPEREVSGAQQQQLLLQYEREGITEQPQQSTGSAPSDTSEFHAPQADHEWLDSDSNGHSVLIGEEPAPSLRERIREGLRPLPRKYYGAHSVDLGSDIMHVKFEPRRTSVFSTMPGTERYVSALLVSHGAMSPADANAFAVDLTRQITFDRALKERPQDFP